MNIRLLRYSYLVMMVLALDSRWERCAEVDGLESEAEILE